MLRIAALFVIFFFEKYRGTMKSTVIITIAISVAVILFFASNIPSKSSKSFQIIQPADEMLRSRATVILPKLVRACPGLNRYADDLSPATINQSTFPDDYQGGIAFKFEVAARPKILPSPLDRYSASNHCSIDIKADGSKAYISKRACHSLCSGVWTENDPGYGGREISLR
jgi:hypothetical protein